MTEKKDKCKKAIDKKSNYMAWYTLFYGLAYLPMKLLFPGKALGVEHLPERGGYILALNHRSGREIPLSFYAIPKFRHFIAKEEHYKSAFCRWIFPKLGVIAINRDKPDLSTIRKTIGYLRKGEIVGIFPEGTRNRDEDADMLQFKNGTALFALQAKVPVVPVYFYRKPRFFRKNYIYIGEPVYPSTESGPVNAEKISEFGGKVRDALESAKGYLIDLMKDGGKMYKKEFKAEKKRMKARKREMKREAEIAGRGKDGH